jgi:hypothetical protein
LTGPSKIKNPESKIDRGCEMSCCGGGVRVAQGQVVVDGGAATGSLVKLVYTGEDRRNLPYVAEGKVYFFGNNERRRVNAVPARVAPQFLEPVGRYYGSFERWVEVESPQGAVDSPQPTGEGPAAASEPPTVTEGPSGAHETALPPVVRSDPTEVAPVAATESPTMTDKLGAAQAEPPPTPAKKKGAGHARA